ncbi:hypothetical protein KPATCC21470_6876 [Kitasatospora purpeofusca]
MHDLHGTTRHHPQHCHRTRTAARPRRGPATARTTRATVSRIVPLCHAFVAWLPGRLAHPNPL